MAFLTDALAGELVSLVSDLVRKEVIMLLGVKDELHKLQQTITDIRCLLKDAEKRIFDEQSPTKNWLSHLESVLKEAKEIIEDCRIKANQLLEKRNSKSEPSTLCCNSSPSPLSCFINVAVRHQVGNKIKKLNVKLSTIHEGRKQFRLEISEILEAPLITEVNTRQTNHLLDPLIVGEELDATTNQLVDDLLIAEKVKCRLFALTGIEGIGKTALAQKIFHHQKIHDFFILKLWVCVTPSYKETDLLKEVIRGVKGKYENAMTKAELLPILRDSFASHQSLFLVLDDVWRADVWLDLLRIPLQTSNSLVRVLVTTRFADDVAKVMKPAHIHDVRKLSVLAGWNMLRRHLFEDEEEQRAGDLKELGLKIVNKCGCLPSAIKAVAIILGGKNQTEIEWEQILSSHTWSISDLHETDAAALQRSYADLPSNLRQSFLDFSLYGELK